MISFLQEQKEKLDHIENVWIPRKDFWIPRKYCKEKKSINVNFRF